MNKIKVLVLIKEAGNVKGCSINHGIPAENPMQANRGVEVDDKEMLGQTSSLGCLLYPKQYHNLWSRRL